MNNLWGRFRPQPWMVVMIFAGGYVLFSLAGHNWNPMSFVLVGGVFDNRVENTSLGYDGQFAYQIGRDPQNGWRYVDVPAYRYQRILYPMLGRMLSMGNEKALPWILILINLASLVGGTRVLERMLIKRGQNQWFSLGYGLYAGLWMAVRLDLTEPLAFLFVLSGLWAFENKSWVLSAGLFVCAALTKEVTLAFSAGCVLSLLANRQIKLGITWGASTFLPFIAWQAVLWAWFGSVGIQSGGALATPVEWIPFHGWWGFAAVNLKYFLLSSLLVLPMAILPAIASLFVSVKSLLQGKLGEEVWSLLLNGWFIMILPSSNILDPLGLTRTIVGLMTAFIYFGLRQPARRALTYALLWLILLIFVLIGGYMPLELEI